MLSVADYLCEQFGPKSGPLERSGSVVECSVAETKGPRVERHCVVSSGKDIKSSLALVQPRKTCPFITERLLMGRKESNQKQTRSVPTNC